MEAPPTEEKSQARDAEQSRSPHRGASYSVGRALSGIGNKRMDAPRLAAAVCQVHPEYIDGRLGEVVPTLRALEKGEEHEPEAWIAEVDRLVNVDATEVIDTPILLFGLALINGGVFRALHNAGVIDPLVEMVVHTKPYSHAGTEASSAESVPPTSERAETKKRAK